MADTEEHIELLSVYDINGNRYEVVLSRIDNHHNMTFKSTESHAEITISGKFSHFSSIIMDLAEFWLVMEKEND